MSSMRDVCAFSIVETTPTATSPGVAVSGMRLRYAARRSAAPKNLANLATASRASGPAFTSPKSIDALSAWKCSDISSISASQFPSNPPSEKSREERV